MFSQHAQRRVLGVARTSSGVGGIRLERDERSTVCAVRQDQILNPRLLAAKPTS
jgi:hypothetical protein